MPCRDRTQRPFYDYINICEYPIPKQFENMAVFHFISSRKKLICGRSPTDPVDREGYETVLERPRDVKKEK